MRAPLRIPLIGLVTALLFFRPLDDTDLFTQIRLGLEFFSGAGTSLLPPVAPHTLAIPNPGWLSQIALGLIWHLGGATTVSLFGAMIVASAIVLRCTTFNREEAVGTLSILGATLATLSLLAPFSSVRPQIFTFLLFVLCIEEVNRRSPNLLLLASILVVWQNLHPSVLVALIPCGAYAVASLVSSERNFRSLLVGALPLFAFFLTPEGAKLFALSASNAAISRETLRISEWLPPSSEALRSVVTPFWIFAPLSLVLEVTMRRKRSLAAKLTMLPLLLLSLVSARFIPYWALAIAPLWVVALRSAFPFATSTRGGGWLTATVATLMFLASFVARSEIAPEIPRSEIHSLRSSLPTGIIYNYYAWAGPLHLFGNPEWRLVTDGRLYLFPRDWWVEYGREARGEVPLDEVLTRYNPSGFLLSTPFQDGLINALKKSGNWKVSAEGNGTVALVRSLGDTNAP